MDSRMATDENPRRFGKALRYRKRGMWRYRLGNYRIVCEIQESKLIVLVVTGGHRSSVYD